MKSLPEITVPRLAAIAVLVISALAVAGCATMSESECRHADWRGLGEQDARQGRAADYFADRAGACGEHGLPADREAYRTGWRRGLEQFCRPGSGFRHGLSGGDYRTTCPPGAEAGFLAGYGLGRDLQQARKGLDLLDGEIASLEEDLADLEDPDGKEADRIRRRLRDRRDEVRVLERELGRLEAVAVERGFSPGVY